MSYFTNQTYIHRFKVFLHQDISLYISLKKNFIFKKFSWSHSLSNFLETFIFKSRLCF